MKILNKYKYLWIVLISIFLFKLISHSLSPLISPYSGFADAHVRVIMAKNDVIPTYGAWFPLHLRLIQFSLALYDNIFISPRILSIIISISLFATFLLYIRAFYKEQIVILVAAFLYVLNPLLSSAFTVPINEPLFALFFLIAFIMLVKRKPFHAVVLFNLAHMIRFESWYFFPIVLFYILNKWSFREVIFLSLGYFIYPLYWMLQNYVYTGDAIFFLSARARHVIEQGRPYRTYLEVLARWGRIFIIQLGFLNVISIFYALKKRKAAAFPLVSSLYLVIMLIIQIYAGSMEWYPEKYVYLPILLIIPVTAKGIVSWWREGRAYLRIALILISLVTIFFWVRQDYFFKARNFQIPEVSKSIQVLGASKINYIYPSEKFPYDRDSLMYFAGVYSYEPIEIGSDFFDTTDLNMKFKYTLFDNFDYAKVCSDCRLIYKDERFSLVEVD